MFEFERITVLDHQNLGKKFIEWALYPKTRPQGATGEERLEDFKKQLAGTIELPLPKWITHLDLIQADLKKGQLLIRLPPEAMLKETIDHISGNGKYILAPFYEERLCKGKHKDNRKFLEMRVGDYTLAHCM